MSKIAVVLVALAILIGGAVYYGEVRYTHGVNAERVKCQEGIKNTLNLTEKQKDSYRIGLNIRNEQYGQINHRLRLRESELRKLQNETKNDCANSRIPDDFK